MVRRALVLLSVALLSGCTSPSKGGVSLLPSGNDLSHTAAWLRKRTPPPEHIARELEKRVADAYVVEPGDVLLVQPANLESPLRLPGDQVVLPDGTIQLGRFGRLQVAGKTIELIEAEVNAVIRRATPEAGPIVVRLATRDSKVFYVLGEVNAPGGFPLRGRETVLDAVLAAGGPNSCASKRRMILVRPTPPCSCRVVLPVDWVAIVQEGDTTTNYQVRAGDRVFVPTKSVWDDLICSLKWKKATPCCDVPDGAVPAYAAPDHAEAAVLPPAPPPAPPPLPQLVPAKDGRAGGVSPLLAPRTGD